MAIHDLRRFIVPFAGLFCALTMVAAPAQGARAMRARLVQCGPESCLRLSGYRPSATAVVRIGARALAVDGGRKWQATVPLTVARTWPIARGYALRVVVADPDTLTERSERVLLPPGALGSRNEIASLVVSAR
ncbi:hypothetical protein [Sphingomonas montana]|uniref:hypothetical protein n=1 Tax=Sphingomonas montana TaxID=1843236 RepID=UPI00096DA01C|nr:hypothetical protein [Sphingomonas montana]